MEKKNDYSELTYEKLKSIIEDVLFNPTPQEREKGAKPFKKLPEGFDLDFQIQDGYMYTCGQDIKMWTGAGGARMMIQSSREVGIPDCLIAQDIYVTDYYNESTKAYWIGDVVWKKIDS